MLHSRQWECRFSGMWSGVGRCRYCCACGRCSVLWHISAMWALWCKWRKAYARCRCCGFDEEVFGAFGEKGLNKLGCLLPITSSYATKLDAKFVPSPPHASMYSINFDNLTSFGVGLAGVGRMCVSKRCRRGASLSANSGVLGYMACVASPTSTTSLSRSRCKEMLAGHPLPGGDGEPPAVVRKYIAEVWGLPSHIALPGHGELQQRGWWQQVGPPGDPGPLRCRPRRGQRCARVVPSQEPQPSRCRCSWTCVGSSRLNSALGRHILTVTVSTVTGIGGVGRESQVPNRRAVVSFGHVFGRCISRVPTVTGIGGSWPRDAGGRGERKEQRGERKGEGLLPGCMSARFTSASDRADDGGVDHLLRSVPVGAN